MSTSEEMAAGWDVPRERRRRAWVRIGIPVGGVGLVILAVLAIAIYSDRVNRAGALMLSEDLLTGLQTRITQQVANYLEPATRAATLARDMAERDIMADRPAVLEAFAASALRQIPQIDALYVADAGGNFMMVQRGTGGGTNTKLIRNAPGLREVQWIRRDVQGRVTGNATEPKDDYDPRTRDWYRGALETDGVFWSGVYVFFTSRAPGITVSVHYRNQEGADRVFGIDITLKALSDFLASLKIGRTGHAVIFDDMGRLVAAADTARMLREQGGQLVTARVDQLGDPALTGAFDRFRVDGEGRRIITVDGQPIVSIVARLPVAGRHWFLMMVVPERDFTGFVATNSRKTLALSLSVVAIAGLLAALLVRQGLRADRTARQLSDRTACIEQQGAAFATLARQSDLFDPSREAPMRVLTETLTDIAAARRTSVWRVIGDGRVLRCEDSFERDSAGHVAGLEITRAELPQFSALLTSGEEFSVSDAANDRRTAELHRLFMHPIDSRSLLVMPIPAPHGVAGALLLEDAVRSSESEQFLRAVANMLATRMRETTSSLAATEIVTTISEPVRAGERSFASDLTLRELDPGAIGAEVYPSVAVMVVKFSDAAAMAARYGGDVSALADHIAAMLQEVAEVNEIPYMKLVGHDVVAAAGCYAADTTAILRIADAAVSVRDRCLTLFEETDHPPSFRIGIDYGIVIGSQVGRQPRMFNLWGEAVRTADAMAASSGGVGVIQVSEAAYHHLRRQFLFRPRGSFYLPRVGSARTFVLAGRL